MPDLQAGSTTVMEIDGSGSGAGTAGTDYDLIVVTSPGVLDYGGTLDLVFGNLVPFADGTVFDLFSFGSKVNFFAQVMSSGIGSYAGLNFSGSGGVWTSSAAGQTITFSESTGQLLFTNSSPTPGIPEIDPASLGSVVALVAGALGLVERRSRRRRA